MAVRAAITEAASNDVQALQQQLTTLQQDVENLKDLSRQRKPGTQNPDISAAIDGIASYSDAGNNINFTPRDVELMIQANADPFVKAYMVLNGESELEPVEETDPFGEVSLGVEEAAIQSTALPYGLAVKAGAFFADFTRLGKVHSHDLPFTDRPASLEQIIGGEDKSRGVEFSWLPPMDHYLRLTAGVVDEIGAEGAVNSGLVGADGEGVNAYAGDDHRTLGSATVYGRAATLLEVSEGAVLHLGVDASSGGNESTRDMASADFKLEWKPDPRANQLFELAGEWLTSKCDGSLSDDALLAGAPSEASAKASGGYIYAQYRVTPIWQPGIRLDLTKPEWFEVGDDGFQKVDDNLRTFSTYLTAYPSEFNRFRLQLNDVHSDNEIADGKNSDTQVLLQWTIVLGAHKHDFAP